MYVFLRMLLFEDRRGILCRKETITRTVEFGYRQDRREKMLAFDFRFVKFKIYKILKALKDYAIVRDTLQSF